VNKMTTKKIESASNMLIETSSTSSSLVSMNTNHWNRCMNQAWVVILAEVLGEESFLDAEEKAARWNGMTAKQKLKAVNRYISKWLRAFNVPDEYSELMHDLHDISELLTGMVRGNWEDESAFLAHVNEQEAAREAAYWAAHPEEAAKQALILEQYFSSLNPANWSDAEREEAKRQEKLYVANVVDNTAEWEDDDTYFEQGPRWVGSDEPPMTQTEKRRLQDMQAGYDTSWEDGSRHEADFYWDLDEPNSYEEFYAEIQVDTTEGEEERWNNGDDIIPNDSDDLWERMENEAIEEAASSDFRVVFWEISWAWVAIYFGSRVPSEVYHSLQGPHCPSYDDYQPSEEFIAEAHESISCEAEVETALDSIIEEPIPVLNQVARLLHHIEKAYYYKSVAEEKIADARADGFGCDFEDGMQDLDEENATIASCEQGLQALGFQGYDEADAWYNGNTTEKQRSSFNFAFTYGYDEDSLDNPENWSDAEREEAERQQKLHEIEVFRNTTEWPDDEKRGDLSVEFNGFHSPNCGKDVPNEAMISLDARETAHPLDIRNMFGAVPGVEEFNSLIQEVLS
jgi:hypothetical protein